MSWLQAATALLNTKGGAGLGQGLGAALGSPGGPSNAESAVYGSGQDGSGWSVNFSGVQSTASNQDKSGGVPGLLGTSGASSGLPGWVWVAGLALVGVAVWRSSRN